MESNVEIGASELVEIVASVFDTMLNLEVAQDTSPWFPSVDRVIAAVQLSGDWNGAVIFECAHSQACQLSGRFLSIDAPAAMNDDVRDVLGELANMIGGNVKGALPGDIRLSMPAVVEGSDYSLRICGAVLEERITMLCAEGKFWVTKYFVPR